MHWFIGNCCTLKEQDSDVVDIPIALNLIDIVSREVTQDGTFIVDDDHMVLMFDPLIMTCLSIYLSRII